MRAIKENNQMSKIQSSKLMPANHLVKLFAVFSVSAWKCPTLHQSIVFKSKRPQSLGEAPPLMDRNGRNKATKPMDSSLWKSQKKSS